MKKIFFLLLSAISLAACDKGSDTQSTITGYNPEQLDQTLYADQTGSGSGFTFTAATSWTTQIADLAPTPRAASGTEAWITIDPPQGDAGTFTLKIVLSPNLTGADRKAEIRIVCGETTLTITIEQKGTTESGDRPAPDPAPEKYITRIDVENDYIDDYSGTEYMTFRYDENMLAEIIATETESYKGVLQHTWVSTTTIGKIANTATPSIRFTIKETVDGKSPRLLEDGTAQFENGRVTSCARSGTDYDKTEAGEAWNDSFKMIYDTDGYLLKTERTDVDGSADNYVRTWSGGNYTKVVWGGQDQGVDEAIYGNSAYKNKANLDLNAFIVLNSEGFDFSFGDSGKILALCGYTGKRCANLATKITETWNDYTKQTTTYTYEFDAEGYPTKIHARTSNNGTNYKITYNK